MTIEEKKHHGMWEARVWPPSSARRPLRLANWTKRVAGPQSASHIGRL